MTTATATLLTIGTDAAGQPVTLPPDILTHTMAATPRSMPLSRTCSTACRNWEKRRHDD